MKKQLIFLSLLFFIILSCKKEITTTQKQQESKLSASTANDHGHPTQTNRYSAEVVTKWMDMQLRLMRTATGIPNVWFTRPYAYSGIALYEAVAPGMPAYQSIASQLNGLTGLPQTEPGFAYHWPSCANAALAEINKQLFSTTSAANKISMDSLENALNEANQSEADPETLDRSVAFGKAIAQKILDWAQTDGNLQASDAYSRPGELGLWEPTPPAMAAASTPYWGNLRLLVPGSGDNAQPGPPTPYSEDPVSDFYQMAKQVYDVSQTLTDEQKAMALYYRDVPGVTTPGHYVSVLKQVLETEHSTLDKAAISYALGGIIVYDGAVSCWTTKYHYNLVRPVTYIQKVLKYTTWLPFLATPAHPEYSSAHAVLSAATADALSYLFGDNHPFTDHTYDYLQMPPRAFSSFKAFGEEAGNSRLYAGIHYQASINTGLEQGRKIAANIITRLKFLKE